MLVISQEYILERNRIQMFEFNESKTKSIYTAQVKYHVKKQEGKVLK